MPETKLVTEPHDVDARLAEFGVQRADVRRIAFGALGARNDSVPFDPKTAPGLFSYIYGVRALRETFVLGAGYEPVSRQNIEAVYDRAANRKIMFQTVENACGIISPKAITEIGTAKQAVIQNSQRFIFPELEEAEELRVAALTDYERAEAWYLCVAFGEDSVACELSRPSGVVEKQFAGFDERIFITDENDPGSGGLMNLNDDTPPIEFKPLILKR